MPKIVLTLMADDRPGLVKSVSNVVVEHGGNWLESRLARLSGKFAGIVSLEVPAGRAAGLRAALQALESGGVRVMLDQGDEQGPAAGDSMVELEIVGADHPGIVHDITRLLESHGINVEEMSTTQRAASMSGSAMFEAWLRVQLPPKIDRARLTGELQKLAQDLLVDITGSLGGKSA